MPFQNIFSKSKAKGKVSQESEGKSARKPGLSGIKIITDIREKNSLVIAELHELGIETEIKHLKVADYLINNIAVERKTVSDFIGSMINKRLVRQLEEIKQYPKQLLIIEGIEEQELYNDEPIGGVNPNAIRGFLLAILLEFQIPIIFTKDYQDTAKFLYILAKKKQPKHISIRPAKKSLSKKEQKQFILEGFPGIGPATAKKLLKEFKTIKNITNTPLENLNKLIGKKADIFKLLEEKY